MILSYFKLKGVVIIMYLVYDVGGIFIKYALVEADGTIVSKNKTPTPEGYRKTLDEFISVMCGIYEEQKSNVKIDGIAVSLPGQIDIENGIVYGGGALPYLDNVNLGRILSEKCDGLKVALENDAKCAALAEAWIGNAQGCKSAVVVVFGTGIGGGIIMDGKVHHGQDLAAGEVSLWIDSISMEDLSNINPVEELKARDDFMDYPKGLWHNKTSMMYLRKTIAKYKNMDYTELSGEMIYQWAEEGDPYVNVLLENMYLVIAKQLCNIYVILAPEIILIGGGISSRPEFIDGVNRYLSKVRNLSRVFRSMKVDTCKYLNDSNLLGALRNYIQLYEE